jgi:hypothetical protein
METGTTSFSFNLNLDILNKKKPYARHTLSVNNNDIIITYECGSCISDKIINIKNIIINESYKYDKSKSLRRIVVTFWSPLISQQNDIYIEDKTGKTLNINIFINQYDFSIKKIAIDDKTYFPLDKPDIYRSQVLTLK